ncbi:MAG TPA: glycosyltransferase, partial [Gemmatimonadales bacterium]|nr:glycosyltransferase [Gemmatimonadales bacterium]
RAAARLRDRNLPFQLRILGEGPADASLRALADQLGVSDHVSWSGFLPQDRMPAEYGAATVTVLPSRGQAEGLGLTLVEALLAGSAVVGTPAGGIPEVIRDGETGLLAQDGDDSDLADKLALILTDSALRSRLTAQGQTAVQAVYGQHQAIARFLELYADITERHGR